MNPVPGSLQGGGVGFEATHWSVVLLAAQSQTSPSAQSALAQFCRAYWPPLYTFLRRRGHSPSDAQDLVQGFFAHLIEANTLSRARQEKGLLRTFLLGAMQNFLANVHDHLRALKRGGGHQIVSLDDQMGDAEAALHLAGNTDALISYDQQWAALLTQRAWEQVRVAYAAEGKAAWLEEVRPLVFGGAASVSTQEEVAQRLGLSPITLRTGLHRLRQRYRQALRDEVAHTVSSSAEIDEEMQHLYRVLLSQQ